MARLFAHQGGLLFLFRVLGSEAHGEGISRFVSRHAADARHHGILHSLDHGAFLFFELLQKHIKDLGKAKVAPVFLASQAKGAAGKQRWQAKGCVRGLRCGRSSGANRLPWPRCSWRRRRQP
jgi:hypothetical protein